MPRIRTSCGGDIAFILYCSLNHELAIPLPLITLSYLSRCVPAWTMRKFRALQNPHLRELTCNLKSLVMMDRAQSTVKKNCLSYYMWCRWAARHGLKPLPAEGCYFVLYLSEIISTASTPSPVIAAVYGVTWAHRKAGITDPASHPLVVQAVGAAKRLLAQPIARKDPIKLDHLKEIADKFDKPGMSLKDLQTLLIILVGFMGFMRWSDLSSIRVENIQILPYHMSILLEKRKNDQFRKGQYVDIARF